VLFGAFGKAQPAALKGEQKEWKQESVEGAAQLLEQARTVVIIPGYGMAVAQAQHKSARAVRCADQTGRHG